jgi:CDGSH-type Zn-finger protein
VIGKDVPDALLRTVVDGDDGDLRRGLSAPQAAALQADALQSGCPVRTDPREHRRGGPMADVEITIRDNGPYLVAGPITLQDAAGNPVDIGGRERVALCRCGGSTKKPFCDGTHSKIGFQGAIAAVEKAEGA